MRQTLISLLAIVIVVSCAQPRTEISESVPVEPTLEIYAESDRQWTGVAVTPDGRVFVNFPRWSPEVPVSVAEALADGTLRPFPDEAWNSWTPDADPSSTFICVQSVVADGQGSLWVLDPANPGFQGVVPGGAKLVEIDAATGGVVRVIGFDGSVTTYGSTSKTRPPMSRILAVALSWWWIWRRVRAGGCWTTTLRPPPRTSS
jgi:hypothetical protein